MPNWFDRYRAQRSNQGGLGGLGGMSGITDWRSRMRTAMPQNAMTQLRNQVMQPAKQAFNWGVNNVGADILQNPGQFLSGPRQQASRTDDWRPMLQNPGVTGRMSDDVTRLMMPPPGYFINMG